MRKATAILLLLIILFLTAAAALADGFKDAGTETAETTAETAAETEATDPETGYTLLIEDKAGLLSESEYTRVTEAMREIAQYCNVGFYTYSGSDRSDVLSKAKRWGEAKFGAGPFTVFIIDMATRRIGIQSSRQVYGAIDTGRANTITDNIYRYATNGNYSECAVQAFSQMLAALKGEKIAAPMKTVSNIMLALLVAILLTYMLVTARMEQEDEVSLPELITLTAAGTGAIIVAKKLTRTVVHESSKGGGGFGGGGGGGGGGFSSGGGGGSHGF